MSGAKNLQKHWKIARTSNLIVSSQEYQIGWNVSSPSKNKLNKQTKSFPNKINCNYNTINKESVPEEDSFDTSKFFKLYIICFRWRRNSFNCKYDKNEEKHQQINVLNKPAYHSFTLRNIFQ